MMIVISSLGKTLESPPNPRFGRTEFFIKYNSEDNTWEALENPAVTQRGGAGIAASQFLVNHNITAAISGHFGPNAYSALNSAKIKMFTFQTNYNTVSDVIQAYKQNSLKEA